MPYDGLQNLNELATGLPLDGASTAELAQALRETRLILKNVLLAHARPDGGLRGIDVNSLAAGSVGTEQLIDQSVTSAKYALLSIIAEVIAAGAVTAEKLADNSVTEAKYADGSIPSAAFKPTSIPLSAFAQLITGTAIQSHISEDSARAIGPNHMQNNSVLDRAIVGMALSKLIGGTVGQIAVRGASGWEAVTPTGGLTYNPGTGIFSIESPATAAYFGDMKSRGVDGGGTTANTWITRDLGEIEDGRNLMTFVGNVFKLVQGSYFIYIKCPAAGAVGGHQARLYRDNGDSTNDIPLWGSSELCVASQSGHSIIQGTFEVTNDDTSFKVEHWFQNTVATTGLGKAASSNNTVVYSNHSEMYTTGYVLKLT